MIMANRAKKNLQNTKMEVVNITQLRPNTSNQGKKRFLFFYFYFFIRKGEKGILEDKKAKMLPYYRPQLSKTK
jgi:hypothetical protein